ncbi:MAG: plasmid stabilization protein [Hyphomicrobiales bacterium]|nr:plasmid stabilization protein [Hyphomicrobiales bacterium]MBV8824051.1 plasmid stabilization protein [Hyphomicrobiales bacterium]MBV9429474.1 plasmid stabilization protein [Bradyrhizobiaceae bacterium]
MERLIIRNLDKALERNVRARAAQQSRSMEEEALWILRAALGESAPALVNLFDQIREHVDPLGGVNLKIPRRRSMRKPPSTDA